MFHEFCGQKIQHFRVRGRTALSSEIFLGFDQSTPKNRGPKPIHSHASGQRVGFVGDPVCKVQTSELATFLRRQCVETSEHIRCNRIAWLLVIPLDENVRFATFIGWTFFQDRSFDHLGT